MARGVRKIQSTEVTLNNGISISEESNSGGKNITEFTFPDNSIERVTYAKKRELLWELLNEIESFLPYVDDKTKKAIKLLKSKIELSQLLGLDISQFLEKIENIKTKLCEKLSYEFHNKFDKELEKLAEKL